MQYFKPEQAGFSVGDCMPFTHDGVFHLFYLLDEGHHNHPVVGEIGGHNWAHASSSDLCEWVHHPLALTVDLCTEGSNCTGSLLVHEGKWYAFYSMRPYPQGGEFFKIAQSTDGIHFEKSEWFMSPPSGYGEGFRDPYVFKAEDGLFHMLITTSKYEDNFRWGCLAHFTSKNLEDWDLQEPFLKAGKYSEPECPDYFEWNGWYYLLYSIDGGTTHYRMSKNPLGPWLAPPQDIPASSFAKVMKTAPWKDNRRIGTAWLPPRDEHNNWLFGGQAVFREIIQHPDGTLGTAFPPEMRLAGKTEPVIPEFSKISSGIQQNAGTITLDADYSLETAYCDNLSPNYRLTARIVQKSTTKEFGFFFSNSGQLSHRIEFNPSARIVSLASDISIEQVEELSLEEFDLEVVILDDLIDVCIDGQRTIINSCRSNNDGSLIIYVENGKVEFKDMNIYPL